MPREDQLTTVLAWLCALSSNVALELARLLLEGDTPALEALGSGPLRVRTQVRLPALPTTGPLYADLSLAAPKSALQLLVEIKLGARFGSYETDDGATAEQPMAYIAAWEKCDKNFEAQVRRVGTITVNGKAQDPGADGRARDITWHQVLDLVKTLSDHDKIGPRAGVVADDLIYYLQRVVLPPSIGEGLLDDAQELVREVSVSLAKDLPARLESKACKLAKTMCVQGQNVALDVGDGRGARFWVALTPEGTTYNVLGWPDVLQLVEFGGQIGEAAKEDLRRAGFEYVRDRSGRTQHRVALGWAELTNQPEPLKCAAAWAYEQVTATGWTDPHGQPRETEQLPPRSKLRRRPHAWWRSRA